MKGKLSGIILEISVQRLFGKVPAMKKNTAWKILNPILLLLAINQAATAIIFDVQGSSRPIISEEVFEFMHEGTGYVFVGLILLHIILNFTWVKANYLKSFYR